MNLPMSLHRALLVGVSASAVYPLVAIGIAMAVGPSFSNGGLGGYLVAVIFALGSIGVPIVLWLRFEYRGPIVLMSTIVVFLTFIMPLIAPMSGESPAFTLVIYWAPLYLIFYTILVGGEYLYRHQERFHDSL